MSSPPANVHNPKKRPSLSVPTSSAKRRKPSTGPSHLRQTSFPPPEGGLSGSFSPPASAGVGTPRNFAFSPSPSVDGSVAASSIANGTESGRGARKRKRGGAHQDDGRSQTGTSIRGGGGKNANTAAEEDADADDDDEGPGDVEVDMGDQKDNEAAKRQEKEHLAMLMNHMNDEQRARYEMLRKVKLKKEVVRRLTNQTLSQSVPQSVVMAIGGYTKLFIMDLLDLAAEVQREWAEVEDRKGTRFPEEVYENLYPAPTPVYNPTPSNLARPPIKKEPIPCKTVEEMCDSAQGPLLPEHLREALRRYKQGREGGGVGFMGLSLEGRENTAVRARGRRLFK